MELLTYAFQSLQCNVTYTFCKQQAITIIYNLQLSTIYTIHTGKGEENNIKFENLNFATVHLKRPYNCGKN